MIIAKALNSYGHDGEACCKEFGVDLQAARDPHTRYSTELMSPLWSYAAKLSGDPLFGLHAGTFVSPSTFHALSLSMWMSGSLYEALRSLVKFGRVFSTAGVTRLSEEDGKVLFSVDFQRDNKAEMVVTRHAQEASASAILSLCRSLYGVGFKPLKVEVIQETPSYAADYEAFFECPVSFGHSSLCLYYNLQVMKQTLPTGNADLLAVSERVILDYLVQLDRDDIVNRVRAKLIELLPTGQPSRVSVAEALGMSLRNLQRKLQEENTSYKNLLDEVRSDLAKQLIYQSHIPLGEISFRLGFSSNSSFSRAFKRWLGIPPGEYRHQQTANCQD